MSSVSFECAHSEQYANVKLLECFPALRAHRSLTEVCQMPGLVLLFGLQIAGQHVLLLFFN